MGGQNEKYVKTKEVNTKIYIKGHRWKLSQKGLRFKPFNERNKYKRGYIGWANFHAEQLVFASPCGLVREPQFSKGNPSES